MRINVRSNIDEFRKGLSSIERRHLPYAVSLAVNATAGKVQRELIKHTRVLDNPTPFTKKGTFLARSHKNRKPITATVGFKDKTAEYLQHVEDGSTERSQSGKAIPVPTDKWKNAYGNIPKGKIRRSLSNKQKFFSGKPKDEKHKGRASGIYQRVGSKGRKNIRCVVTWSYSIQHSKKTRFTERAKIVAQRNFNKELVKNMSRAMGAV